MLIFVAVGFFAASSVAEQVRTYEFIVADEFNYSSDCGICPLVFGTRGRVTGTFEVLLDFDSGVGALQSIDVTLVDVATLIGRPAEWLSQSDRPFFGDSPIFDPYSLPLPGVLESVGNELVLSTNGTSTPGAAMYPLPEVYRVTMSGSVAKLGLMLPFIDFVPRITSASATLISSTPEPSALASAALGIAILLVTRRFRYRSQLFRILSCKGVVGVYRRHRIESLSTLTPYLALFLPSTGGKTEITFSVTKSRTIGLS